MKNEYTINKALIKQWAKQYHLMGTADVVLFVLLCICGGIGLLLLTVLILTGGDWITWYISILCILLSVYKLFFQRFIIWNKRYQLWKTTYGVVEWLHVTEFNDEDILVTDHTSQLRLKYENIGKIKENGNQVLLFFNHRTAIRIYKDAFVTGSWEDCKKHIEEKRK